MHLTREESHQDHRHKGQIGIQRHKLNGKKRKWWWGVEERSKGKGEMVEWEGSKAQTKVLMCCSQSQRVLALPGSLASGAYWCETTSSVHSWLLPRTERYWGPSQLFYNLYLVVLFDYYSFSLPQSR